MKSAVVIETGTLFQPAEPSVPQSYPQEVIEFLNRKIGTHFRPVSANIDAIKARLKEGATVQEIKSVIAMKRREWIADRVMSKFLRPATLFNKTKFWQYHGQLIYQPEGEVISYCPECDRAMPSKLCACGYRMSAGVVNRIAPENPVCAPEIALNRLAEACKRAGIPLKPVKEVV